MTHDGPATILIVEDDDATRTFLADNWDTPGVRELRNVLDDRGYLSIGGVEDVARAKELISSTALLELKLVEQGPFPTREAALQAYGNKLPGDSEMLPGRGDGGAAAGSFSAVYVV